MGTINNYLMAAMAAIFWGANFNLAGPVVTEMGPYIASASRYILRLMRKFQHIIALYGA